MQPSLISNFLPKTYNYIDSIIINLSNNREFAHSKGQYNLIKIWFLSNRSFKSNYVPYFLQKKWYFTLYIKLFFENHIDSTQFEYNIKKLVIWLNNWDINNKINLKNYFGFLKYELPEYTDYWNIVKFD